MTMIYDLEQGARSIKHMKTNQSRQMASAFGVQPPKPTKMLSLNTKILLNRNL